MIFQLDPARSTFDASVSALGQSDEDVTSLTGTVAADLEVDTSGAVPALKSIAFTGGEVTTTSPLNYSLTVVVVVFPVTFSVDINDVSGTVTTPMPPSELLPVLGNDLSYDVDASEHELVLNQGVVDVSGPVNTMIDFNDNPVVGAAPSGTFGTLELTPNGANQFDLEFELPIDIVAQFEAIEGVTATVEVTGAAVSTAQLSLGPSGPAADFDGDGDVDDDDFAIWVANAGTTSGATSSTGDSDGDGDVDGFDFLAIQRGHGQSGNVANATSIPEPSAVVLICIGAVVWLRQRA